MIKAITKPNIKQKQINDIDKKFARDMISFSTYVWDSEAYVDL